MDERFKIFLEQLKSGGTERIDIACSPDFLGVNEENLHYEGSVRVKGEVYLADEELILHFDASAQAIIPCSICNEPVEVKTEVLNYYHAESTAEIKTGFFNFQALLREAILLEAPQFAECEGGCPQRRQLDKFLKKPKASGGDGYQPFADVNLDQFKP